MEILLESDNSIRLTGAKDEDTGAFLNSATVTYSICPQGSTTPITGGTGMLSYLPGSDGNYLGVVNGAIVTPGLTNGVVEGALYNVKLTLVQGNYDRVWRDLAVMVFGE